jgi:hypothetical protein
LNGVVLASPAKNFPIPSAAAPLTIGAAQDLFLPGMMDEISIYNRALTDVEMQTIYADGGKGKCGTGQTSATLSLESPGFAAGAQFQFQIVGGPGGAAITVQSSSDLMHWSNVWQSTGSGSPMPFTDTNNMSSRRFYRALSSQ